MKWLYVVVILIVLAGIGVALPYAVEDSNEETTEERSEELLEETDEVIGVVGEEVVIEEGLDTQIVKMLLTEKEYEEFFERTKKTTIEEQLLAR